MNIRLLTALNIAHSDSELLDYIGFLAGELERGTISAVNDGDLITRLELTPAGRALSPPTLPTAST
jgi:hypothetical protein